MSTNNMSDEELDNLFRKSADSIEPPYDPEDWIAMEEKLDVVNGTQPRWYKFLYPLLILLLATTSIVIFKATEEPPANEPSHKIPSEPKFDTSLKDHSKPLADQSNYKSSLKLDGKVITDKPPGAAQISKFEHEHLNTTEQKSTEQNNFKTLNTSRLEKYYESYTINRYLGKIQPPDKNINKSEIQFTFPETSLISERKKPEGSTRLPAEAVADQYSSINGNTPDKRTLFSSLTFTVVVAPDITTVRFKDPETISVNAGMLLSVPLTRKFSIVTGAVWANKVYNTDPESYRPSYSFWDGKKLPSSIIAACQVLDIPLNISYQVIGSEKDIVSIQTGLSSYIMLREKYTYKYTNGYSNYNKTHEISNQNRHWFGVQNISVNYNRKLSPVISVGVEPFVKIPLSGIGTGNIRLSSAGVFVTAGYTLSIKSKGHP